MAKIVLDVGETFEHSHRRESATKLLTGDLEVEFGGQTHHLAPGDSITVPGETPHTLRNCAPGESVVQCDWHKL